VLLSGVSPLRPSDAVAAVLLLDDGRYVMQLRDERPDIFFPGHWGCFGGGVDGGETPRQALARELREELELDIGDATAFVRFDFDFTPVGQPKVFRQYFEVRISRATYGALTLHEGAAFDAFPAGELLAGRRVAPYDAFAIWTHASANRFRAQP